MICYKLTNSKDRTYGKTQWGEGITRTTSGEGDLCGPGWLHAYEHPLLAVLHNPIHGNYDLKTAHMWECEALGEIRKDGQMKLGCTEITTVRRIDLPVVTDEQRIRYAIKCAWTALRGKRKKWVVAWRRWARAWIDGTDRSEESARAAAAARSGGRAAAQAAAATWAETAAAWAATWAAEADVDLIKCAEWAVGNSVRL